MDMLRRGKVLIVGGGAREHALVRALVRSGSEVVVAPGNPGIAQLARLVPVRVDDIGGLVELARLEGVDLVVVGPELPLTLGLADALRSAGFYVFGPGRAAASLEGSKAFMKDFLVRHGIPTARHRLFVHADDAIEYVRQENRPLVVKTDGLAAGKGVTVAKNRDEAIQAIHTMMVERAFGAAGDMIIIEDVLPGEEVSFHVVCAVEGGAAECLPLAASQDHKRIFDGDQGPNTGGMGAYAPAPIVTPAVYEQIMELVVDPTLAGLVEDGLDYHGVLFVGLMIENGEPSVLEFNVRFGDPEATVILPQLGDDAFALLMGAARGRLPSTLDAASGAALSVVIAAEGYPGTPRAGDPITGLQAHWPEGTFVHHAGTRLDGDKLVTAGGRIFAVTGDGATLEEAHARAYDAVQRIQFRGMQYRKDIGFRALI